nr:3a accessory peptide [Infectious bronchitis virus]
MCKCKLYLTKLFLQTSVYKHYNRLIIEDDFCSSFCFALSLQELIQTNQIFLTFSPKVLVVNNIEFTQEEGFIKYKGKRIFESGIFKS